MEIAIGITLWILAGISCYFYFVKKWGHHPDGWLADLAAFCMCALFGPVAWLCAAIAIMDAMDKS